MVHWIVRLMLVNNEPVTLKQNQDAFDKARIFKVTLIFINHVIVES